MENLTTCLEWQNIPPYDKNSLFISGFQIITIDAEALLDDGENAKHQNAN